MTGQRKTCGGGQSYILARVAQRIVVCNASERVKLLAVRTAKARGDAAVADNEVHV